MATATEPESKSQGIDLRSGNLTTDKLGYHRDIQTNRLQKVISSIGFVQWVFVPDGKSPVPVAAKQEVKGLPATSGHAWDIIRNGPLNAQANTKLNGIDYASTGHSILGMHGNSGITFDLKKVREANGWKTIHLTTTVGFGAKPDAAKTLADFTVYVDTEQKFQRRKMRKDEFATLDLVVPVTAKTLTLVATDGGDGISSDLLFLGDAKLTPEINPQTLAAADQEQLTKLRAQAKQIEATLRKLPEPTKVYAIVSDAKPPVVQVQRRGNPEDPQDEVHPATFAWPHHANVELGTNDTPEGQRRLALANWITNLKNPLTARVLANRLWHHHFGQGIVNTPSDFGLGGDKPSHTEVLDLLASEFMKGGQSIKHLQKLIVMSAAYRQSSAPFSDKSHPTYQSYSKDTQNRLISRQNPRRLDAESLRDAVLSVAGTLNPERGGPGYRDFNYTEAYAPIYDYTTADEPELWKRSIYRFIVRTTPQQFMSTLDCPNPANFTPARVQTTTALQALALSNNEFMLQQARHLSTRIEKEASTPEAQIRRAFALTLQRQPNTTELDAAQQLVTEQTLFALCRMLINTNEFVYVD